MAQPQHQQQYPMPQRSFSPPGSATSPVPSSQYPIPAAKRPRLSPDGPHPNSHLQYNASPYSQTPNTPVASPGQSPTTFTNVGLPSNAFQQQQNGYNSLYANSGTMNLTLPHSQQSNHQHPAQSSPVSYSHQGQQGQVQNYNNYAMSPMAAPQGPGTMGPPSKPVEKQKEDGIDPLDVLANTGIDLREEENFSFNYPSQYSTSGSATSSFGPNSQNPPGSEATLYGAGFANSAAEKVTGSQEDITKLQAETAWHNAAYNLAKSRQKELNHPFLQVNFLQKKMEDITKEHGLNMNLDHRGMMGHMKLPNYFPNKEVKVQTQMGQDAGFISTSGTFVPMDAMLVDQVALLSIATKHRLRTLLEDAAKLSKGRQTTAHGNIPDEWADVAVPSDIASSVVVEGAPRTGWESAVSPRSNPLKRSFSTATELSAPAKVPKITNEVVAAFRSEAQRERDAEEARLRKRNARTTVGGAARQSSVVPGTPGSIAPEAPEKAPTKKEAKKKADAKVNEAANHSAANATLSQFSGSAKGLFGKKKKYSWMDATAGGSASGASTPSRVTGLPGTPAVNLPPEKLTADGVRRLGAWREDKEKGKHIQMRDWITVLESDGHEKKTLQKAYLFLDQSDPK